jgi:transcriptional regulator GlxA family with amidase domain
MTERSFGFLMFPDFEELDLVGPWEMATMWRALAGGPRCLAVAAQPGVIRCAKGLGVLADHGFDDCPALDYLLVPGGAGTRVAMQDGPTLEFLRRQAAGARAVLSVCTGSIVLAAAGLLDGRAATTHWKAIPRLRAYPAVTLREERWVRDGTIWTSAGVSAGMDLLLAFIAAEDGEEAASATQAGAEYYPDGRIYRSATRRPEAPAYVGDLP